MISCRPNRTSTSATATYRTILPHVERQKNSMINCSKDLGGGESELGSRFLGGRGSFILFIRVPEQTSTLEQFHSSWTSQDCTSPADEAGSCYGAQRLLPNTTTGATQ